MSDPLLPALAAFATTFVAALALTPAVGWAMRRLGVMDEPTEDRWHREPVALLGGIAIYGSFATTMLWLPRWDDVALILALGCAIFLLGLYDDRFGTHPRIKFLAQIGAALTVVSLETAWLVPPVDVGDLFRLSLAVLWLVGLTNAMNLLDNMDGLSAGVAAIGALAISLLALADGQHEVLVLSLGLCAACLGFLPWNYRPARLFMGDCGSLFLGFTLAALSLEVVLGSRPLDPARALAPILILSLPIFDTSFVTVMRVLHGRRPWRGGRDHTSHRLALILGRERRAVNLFYLLAAAAGLQGALTWHFGLLAGLPLVLVWCLALLWVAGRLAQLDVYTELAAPRPRERRQAGLTMEPVELPRPVAAPEGRPRETAEATEPDGLRAAGS